MESRSGKPELAPTEDRNNQHDGQDYGQNDGYSEVGSTVQSDIGYVGRRGVVNTGQSDASTSRKTSRSPKPRRASKASQASKTPLKPKATEPIRARRTTVLGTTVVDDDPTHLLFGSRTIEVGKVRVTRIRERLGSCGLSSVSTSQPPEVLNLPLEVAKAKALNTSDVPYIPEVDIALAALQSARLERMRQEHEADWQSLLSQEPMEEPRLTDPYLDSHDV